MSADNYAVTDHIDAAADALHAAHRAFREVYPDADVAEDPFFLRLRSIESSLDDLASEVENR